MKTEASLKGILVKHNKSLQISHLQTSVSESPGGAERRFADRILLRELRCGDYRGLCERSLGPYKREVRVSEGHIGRDKGLPGKESRRPLEFGKGRK